MRSLLTAFGLLIAAIAMSSHPAKASEWGCEILLCASSADPSWHGVAECHRPMERLIKAMRHPGFSWPTCPEAGTAGPGYERYGDCPQGWMATNAPNGDHGDRELSYCAKANSSEVKDQRFASLRNRRTPFSREYMSRPVRSDPYYFDIRDSTKGTVDRHWFNLRR